MNLVTIFKDVLPKLEACQVVASNHKMHKGIPDDNLHCYPGAWECMQSLLACKQPTQSQAQDLIWFLVKVAMFDTLDAQDIADNFEVAYGYKLTV
tara:strand:+ start:61 stop:345 length:285 start_codon:yes stop_codon:yes gene_type:complete